MVEMDLVEDLQKKLQQLRSLVEHPGLYIVDFFFSLRTEVDYDAESLLARDGGGGEPDFDLGKRSIDGLFKTAAQEVTTLEKVAQVLNQARQQVIDELNRYQLLSLGLRGHIGVEESGREYQHVSSRVSKLMSNDLGLSEHEREVEYEAIAREIWRLENEIKRTLLANRTFHYFKSSSSTRLGVLFVLEDFYLDQDELDCLNHLRASNDSTLTEETGPREVLRDVLFHLRSIIEYQCLKEHERLLARAPKTIKLSKSSLILWNFYKYQRSVALNSSSESPETLETANHIHATRLDKIAEFVSSRDTLPRNAQPYAKLYSNMNLDELALGQIDHDALQYFMPNALLNQINLTCNCLTSLHGDQFANMSFSKLDLTSNYLETIPRGLFGNNLECLQQLNISSNYLKSIDKNVFSALANCQTLSLSHNLLKFDNDKDENVFRNLYKLNRLYLQSNLLDELPSPSLFSTNLAEYSSLVKLDLSENRIRYLPCDWSCFIVLPNLEILNLSSNKIAYLSAKMFQLLKSLRILDLSFNLIVRVEDAAFVHQDALIELNLSNNRLEYLSAKSDLFSQTNGLKKLDLSYNRLSGPHALASLANLRSTCTLNLEANHFSPTDGSFQFNGLGNLRNLTLAGCHLKALKSSNLSTLSELDLKRNRLDTITDECLLTGPQPELRKLFLNSNKVESIDVAAFKQFANLVCLNLSSNQLTLLKRGTFDDLAHLQVLDLSKNHLSDIDANCFRSLGTCLCKLVLSENQLTSAEFVSHLSELKDVVLSENRISSLNAESFAKLRKLQHVDLANNCLQEFNGIVFSPCTRLMNIKLSGNKLRQFEASQLSQELHWLDLSMNKLDALSPGMFEHLSNLETLKLNNNIIRAVDTESFRGLQSLKKLDISDNCLQHIEPQTFDSLTGLKSLCVGGNKLDCGYLSLLEPCSLLESIALNDNKLGQLETLLLAQKQPLFAQVTKIDLAGNAIESFGAFKLAACFPNLKCLTLTQNKLKSLDPADLVDLTCLVELDLSYNELQAMVINEELPNLETLKLNNNRIRRLNRRAFRRAHKLRKLDLSMNELSELDDGLFYTLGNLESLSLSDNCLGELNIKRLFEHTRQLKRLNLSKNQLDNSSISSEAFESCLCKYELAFLDLSFNKIQHLDFLSSLYGLNELKLNNNLIESLPDRLFDQIKYLYELDLAHNLLTVIKRQTFENMAKLEEVDLAFNKIETIEPSAFKDLIRLKRLNLEGNPIHATTQRQGEAN